MDSPLTQQSRPDTFEPKIVQLYQQIFGFNSVLENDDVTPSEGFWREMFLLRPEKQKLDMMLDPLIPDDILHLQHQTRLFFKRAIEEAGSGISPRNENALENLTGFLSAVLNKRYTNPSTDVIEVLAGLNTIDRIISDFVQGLEAVIRSSPKLSFRHRAVDAALAMVSGSYQTSLVTYFIHRDLFPALMKYAQESVDPVAEGLALLGLLANYNKFEAQNMYQYRLEDYVNEEVIRKLVVDFASVCHDLRNHYIDLQDDAPVPWSLNSTLSFVGLRALSKEQKKPTLSEEDMKVKFNVLPPPKASVLLTGYSFIQANKIFCSQLLLSSSMPDKESPLSTFLSTTSYLCHHAYRSTRATHYAELSLLTIRVLLDDTIHLTRISSADNKIQVRLARQRPPYLPYIADARIPATAILDICTDTLSHNLRKRLSIPLYNLTLIILHRLISHLDMTKTRLQHHWPHIWASLLSLLRFLTQYSSELTPIYAIRAQICTPLTSLLVFCLSRGDNFLPDPTSYDDLFYKLIETSAIVPKFKEAYCPKPLSSSLLSSSSSSTTASSNALPGIITPGKPDQLTMATSALISITSHFQSLLTSGGRRTHQSPAAVQKIIKEGYETLPDLQSAVAGGGGGNATAATVPGILGMPGVVDFGYWEKWRESEWKVEIKKIIRTVVEDGRLVALKSK